MERKINPEAALISEVWHEIMPLDLVLFKGTDLFSETIRFVEQECLREGSYSHCGVVVNAELFTHIPQLRPGHLYVWESTVSYSKRDLPDVETGHRKMGAQIRDLARMIPLYLDDKQEVVAWCPLTDNPWRARPKEDPAEVRRRRRRIAKRMGTLHRRFGRAFYDFSVIDLLAAVSDCLRPTRDLMNEMTIGGHQVLASGNLKRSSKKGDDAKVWLFCSDLVAAVYVRLRILPSDINPADVTPVEFLGVGGVPRIVDRVVHLSVV